MPTLILYTTAGCHLCEQAKALTLPHLEPAGFQLEEVDIADSQALMDQYGTSIPVLENPETGAKLYWPFGERGIDGLLHPAR